MGTRCDSAQCSPVVMATTDKPELGDPPASLKSAVWELFSFSIMDRDKLIGLKLHVTRYGIFYPQVI